jgi:hypothetical protein
MLFPKKEHVNQCWSLVAHATAENNLGIAAKIAAESNEGEDVRPICVYTQDFNDQQDVLRVVEVLAEMELLPRDERRGIWYKCDAYTHLGIQSGNEFSLPASMYGSKALLASNQTAFKRRSIHQPLDSVIRKKRA